MSVYVLSGDRRGQQGLWVAPTEKAGGPGSPHVNAATVCQRDGGQHCHRGPRGFSFQLPRVTGPLRASPGTTRDEPDHFWVVNWWPQWDLECELFSPWFWANGSQPVAWRPRLCLQQHRPVVTLSFPGTRLLHGRRGSRSCLLFILRPSPSPVGRLVVTPMNEATWICPSVFSSCWQIAQGKVTLRGSTSHPLRHTLCLPALVSLSCCMRGQERGLCPGQRSPERVADPLLPERKGGDWKSCYPKGKTDTPLCPGGLDE